MGFVHETSNFKNNKFRVPKQTYCIREIFLILDEIFLKDRKMKRFIVTLAAVAMTCGAMFAQSRGDMYVGGILGVSGGSSKTNVTIGSTTVKGDATPSDTEFNLTGEFGYFFADNWRVSGSLGYGLQSTPTVKKDDKWLRDNLNLFTIGPSIAYYLNVAGDLYYTPEFGFYGCFGQNKTDLTSSTVQKNSVGGFGMSFAIGQFEFRPTAHLGLSVNLLAFDYAYLKIKGDDSDNYSTTSAVQFSLGIHPSVGFRYYF